jgi:hypothetical protein
LGYDVDCLKNDPFRDGFDKNNNWAENSLLNHKFGFFDCDSIKTGMEVHPNFTSRLRRLLVKPQFILFCFALYNLLDIPVRFGATCLFNYKPFLWFAFQLFLAAAALWLGKWWSLLGAAGFTGYVVYGFVYATLKVFNVLPTTPDEIEKFGTPANWIGFMRNNPEEPLQILLAALIGIFAIVGLARLAFGKRIVLS